MASDDFAGTGALDGNWTATSGTAPERSSGAAISASGFRHAHYSGASFADDQYSEGVVELLSSGFTDNGVQVRASVTNGGTWYRLRMCPSCGDLEIRKRVSFSESSVASGGTVATSGFPFSHTLRLEVEGTALRAYLDGVLTISTTDASIASGAPGFGITDGDGQLLSWAGGDLTPPADEDHVDSDTGSGTEGTIFLEVGPVGADSGSAAESANFGASLAISDAGTGTESVSIAVTTAGTDTGTGSDAGTQGVPAVNQDHVASDTATSGEFALVLRVEAQRTFTHFLVGATTGKGLAKFKP